MHRYLPWLLLVVALGATLFFVVPMLLGDGEGPGSDVEELEHDQEGPATEDGASLLGARGAAERLRRSSGAYRIDGTVLGSDDQPVAGVRVAVRRRPDRADVRRGSMRSRFDRIDAAVAYEDELAAEVMSTEDGSFAVDLDVPGRFTVASHPEAPLCGSVHYPNLNRDKPRVTVRLYVEEGSALHGRVLDADGVGVEAAIQLTQWRSSNLTWRAGPVVSSADDGTYRFPAIRRGSWYCTVRVPGRVRLAGVRVKVPHEGPFDVRLGEGSGTLVGKVTGPADQPVEGADILVSTGAASGAWGPRATVRGTSQADGTFRIGLVPAGEVTDVIVLHDAYLPYADAAPLAAWSGARVRPDETTRLDLELKIGTVVEGRVVDGATGAPLQDAEVSVAPNQSAGSAVQSGTTDEQGRYRVEDVPPGKHLLLARHATHYLPALEKGVPYIVPTSSGTQRFEGPPRELNLLVRETDRVIERDLSLLPGGTIEGRVVGPDGAPVAGADVRPNQYGVTHAAGIWGASQPSTDGPPATSDEEGRFRLEGLPPRDDWILYAAKQPLQPVASEPVEVKVGGPPAQVTLELAEGATISGHVLASDGTPLEAQVHAYPMAYEPHIGYQGRSATTDLDGYFHLEGVTTGGCRLSAWAQDHGGAMQEVEDLKPGEVREGLVLQLEAGVRFAGVLVDPEGEPLPSQQVAIQTMNGGNQATTRTDEEGRFLFENAPAGKVKLQVYRQRRRGQVYQSSPIVVGKDLDSPSEGVRLVYEADPAFVIEGTVLDSDGKPVPICRVRIEASGQAQQYGYAPQQAQLDLVVDGHFRREVQGKPPFGLLVNDARDAAGNLLNLKPHTERITGPGEQNVEIKLERGREVKGRVLDPDGKGVTDVLVHARSGSSVTDEQGRFVLGGLTESGDVIQAVAPTGYVDPAPIQLEGNDGDVVFRIQRAAPIEGRVVDEEDQPVTGTYLTIRYKKADGSQHYASAQVDSLGNFTVEGLPEDARADITARSMSMAGSGGLSPVTIKDVRAGTKGLTLRMTSGVTIEGMVVDADGEPFTSAYIMARRGEDWQTASYAQVASDGSFKVRGVQPGPYELHVQRQQGGATPPPLDVVAPATGVRIVIPRAAFVRGRLAGEGNLEGFYIGVVNEDGSFVNLGGRPKVAEDGAFVVEGVAEGTTYRLQAKRIGDDRYALSGPVQAGDEEAVLTLEQGHAIAGTLDSPDGSPVATGYVWVKSKAWSSGGSVKDGAFRIRGLPPGHYTCKAMLQTPTGSWGGQQDDLAEVEAGDENVRLRLR